MSFTFTKNKHNEKINVWHNGIFIGQLNILLRENKNLDWNALRADKTLKVDVRERWKRYYIVNPTIRTFDENQIYGKYNTKEDAAAAILKHHHDMHEAEMSTRSSAG